MQQHLKQLMMTLALLVTAAAGAWADIEAVYKNDMGNTLPASVLDNNRCWSLQIKADDADAQLYTITAVNDDKATAISAVNGSPADNGAVYTLDGRKVTNPAKKGVYIVNGKKVIIK